MWRSLAEYINWYSCASASGAAVSCCLSSPKETAFSKELPGVLLTNFAIWSPESYFGLWPRGWGRNSSQREIRFLSQRARLLSVPKYFLVRPANSEHISPCFSMHNPSSSVLCRDRLPIKKRQVKSRDYRARFKNTSKIVQDLYW